MESQVKKRAYISIQPQEATFTDKGGIKWRMIRIGVDLVKLLPDHEQGPYAVIQTDAAQLREIAEFAEHGT